MKQVLNAVRRYNPVTILFEAFFCTRKNGSEKKEFSAKKFWAFFFCLLALANHVHLHLDPKTHFVVALTVKKVATAIQVALISSLDALAFGALAVYGWAKAKNAA